MKKVIFVLSILVMQTMGASEAPAQLHVIIYNTLPSALATKVAFKDVKNQATDFERDIDSYKKLSFDMPLRLHTFIVTFKTNKYMAVNIQLTQEDLKQIQQTKKLGLLVKPGKAEYKPLEVEKMFHHEFPKQVDQKQIDQKNIEQQQTEQKKAQRRIYFKNDTNFKTMNSVQFALSDTPAETNKVESAPHAITEIILPAQDFEYITVRSEARVGNNLMSTYQTLSPGYVNDFNGGRSLGFKITFDQQKDDLALELLQQVVNEAESKREAEQPVPGIPGGMQPVLITEQDDQALKKCITRLNALTSERDALLNRNQALKDAIAAKKAGAK